MKQSQCHKISRKMAPFARWSADGHILRLASDSIDIIRCTHDDYLFMQRWANLFSLPDGRLQLRSTILLGVRWPTRAVCSDGNSIPAHSAHNISTPLPYGNVVSCLCLFLDDYFLFSCVSLSLSVSQLVGADGRTYFFNGDHHWLY